MIGLLIRWFVPNAEDTNHPAVRKSYGTLSGCVGIFMNLLLFFGKLFAGMVTASIAITADAFNNLSDAGSSVVTLIGFRMAGKKADRDHPFGHGRIEYLAGLLVSLVILLVGVELAKSSVGKILHPEDVQFSLISLGILAAAIAGKVWMYFLNRTLGRRIGSAAMGATATDSLTDSVATAVVLVSSVVGHYSGLQIDGIAGVLVSVFILYAGFHAARDTLNPLLGETPDPQLVEELECTVLAHAEILGLHDLVIHDYGPGRSMMSLHAEVDKDSDLLMIHDVIDDIERELGAKFSTTAVIHMDPIDNGNEQTLALRMQVAELVKQMDEEITIHDFRITPGPKHTNLIFDIVVPPQFRLSDSQAVDWIREHVRELDPCYYAVVDVDHAYVK